MRPFERPRGLIFLKGSRKSYPRTPLVNRTLFGAEFLQLIAILAVFWFVLKIILHVNKEPLTRLLD